jgi:thiamine pyrophosphokinase
MNKRPKYFRKKIDEDDVYDPPSAVVKKFTKKGPSTISFDEDDDSDIFNVKKSKQSKLLKKSMNQAPNILQSAEIEHDIPIVSTGGSYSEKALQELRESQKFKITIVESSEEIGVTDMTVVTDELLEELNCAEVVNWHQLSLLKGSVAPVHSLGDTKEDEIAWEDQLAARGGIKLDHRTTRMDYSESKRQDMRLSILSTQQSLEKNLLSLGECCTKQSKQIESTQATLSLLKDEMLLAEEHFDLKNLNVTFLKVVTILSNSGLTDCRNSDYMSLMSLEC